MEFLISRKQVFIAVFIIVFLYILYLTAGLFFPFFSSLFWAGFIAYAVFPLHKKMVLWLKGRRSTSAFLLTLFTILLVVGPTIALLVALSSQMLAFYQELALYVRSEGGILGIRNLLESFFLKDYLSYPFLKELKLELYLQDIFINAFRQVSTNLGSYMGSMLKNAVTVIINLFIMVMALFFFFRNGEDYVKNFYEMIPLPDEQKRPVAEKFDETMFAVIYGMFFVAVFQGIMVGFGLAIFGFTFSIFWGFLAFVLALIPIVGAALIWIPAALYLLLDGQLLDSFLLTIWGLLFTTVPDTLIKPLLIGQRAKLPFFFLILGIIGGLRVYGIQGIMIGPLVVALMGTFIQIYREYYLFRKGDQPEDPQN